MGNTFDLSGILGIVDNITAEISAKKEELSRNAAIEAAKNAISLLPCESTEKKAIDEALESLKAEDRKLEEVLQKRILPLLESKDSSLISKESFLRLKAAKEQINARRQQIAAERISLSQERVKIVSALIKGEEAALTLLRKAGFRLPSGVSLVGLTADEILEKFWKKAGKPAGQNVPAGNAPSQPQVAEKVRPEGWQDNPRMTKEQNQECAWFWSLRAQGGIKKVVSNQEGLDRAKQALKGLKGSMAPQFILDGLEGAISGREAQLRKEKEARESAEAAKTTPANMAELSALVAEAPVAEKPRRNAKKGAAKGRSQNYDFRKHGRKVEVR